MKILQLAQFLPPISGGEERHVVTLSTALAARGHEVTLLSFAREPDGPEGPGVRIQDSVRVVRVRTGASHIPGLYQDRTRPYALPVGDPLVSRAIGKELAGGGFDVVHAHNWIVNSALTPAARAGVPVVMSVHDYSHTCATKRFMEQGSHLCSGPSAARCRSCAATYYGSTARGVVSFTANAWSSKRRSRQVRRFAAVSNAVAEVIKASPPWLQGARPQVEVIPNFIRDDIVVDEIAPAAADSPILFVGALCADKGVQPLLDAYRLLDDPPPLLLAGHPWPGTSWDFPEGVRWLGQLPYDEVLALHRSARLTVVPSRCPDSCPTVVLEAMASGRPVVGTNTGGISDLVVDGVTGLLVPTGDAPALAESISTLLGDPDLARRFGEAGHARVRDYTVSAVITRIEQMYATVIDEARQD